MAITFDDASPVASGGASWTIATDSSNAAVVVTETELDQFLAAGNLAIIDGDTDDATIASDRVQAKGDIAKGGILSWAFAAGYKTPLTGVDTAFSVRELRTEFLERTADALNDARSLTMIQGDNVSASTIDAIFQSRKRLRDQWRASVVDGSMAFIADRRSGVPALPSITDQPGVFQIVPIVRNHRRNMCY